MIDGINIESRCKDSTFLIQKILNSSVAELYVSALECQVRLCSEAVKNNISEFSLWQNSQSILDAGCGPGAFVNEHAETIFKGKSYLGIDLDQKFIEYAQQNLNNPILNFEVASLYEFSGKKYDVVLLWAVLQHLPDVVKALDHLKLIAEKGFVILDTKPGDYDFEANPNIPSLAKYYGELQEKSLLQGRNNDCIEEAKKWAGNNGWKIAVDNGFQVVVDSPEKCQVQFYYALFVGELFKRKYEIQVDLNLLEDDLKIWLDSKSPTMTAFRSQWLVLEKP